MGVHLRRRSDRSNGRAHRHVALSPHRHRGLNDTNTEGVDRLIGSEIVDDPYPFYARLRREAPVWNVPGTCAYFVATWDLVAEAAARVDDFSNHFRHVIFSEDDGAVGVLDHGESGGPDVFAGADPPDHAMHRRLFFPELMQKKMDSLEGDVEALTDELLDEMLASEHSDAAAGIANPLPMRVITGPVIGFRNADPAQTQSWVFAGSRMMGGRLRLDEMAAVGEQLTGMPSWIAAELDEALAVHGDADVLSAAAAGVREGILTRDEAAFTLMVLLGAGGETTTSLIGNAIHILAEHRGLQDHLRAEPDRVAAFVEEVLRFEAPFRFHPRMALHATHLGGVEIPERAMVALLWASANRDESVYDRADEIALDRGTTRPHLGFGRGIHHCVGAPLARLESRIVLTKLLERTERFSLDPDHPSTWVDSLWVRRHERLPLVAIPAGVRRSRV